MISSQLAPSNINYTAHKSSTEDVRFKRSAKKLAEEILFPRAAITDESGTFPDENIKAIAKQGLLSVGISKENGGAGGNIKSLTIIVKELAKGCPSTAMAYLMHSSVLPIINVLANESQKVSILQKIVENDYLGSYSMSEKGTGSRLWHMDSYAEERSNGFMIDSFKSFATSSGFCDFYILPVRSAKHKNSNELSIFYVDGKDPNIKIIGKWDGMGLRGNSSTPVHFNNCLVPKENLLGVPDTGFNLLMAYTFPPYIIGLAAVYTGIAEAAFSHAIKHITSRTYTDSSNSLANVETIQRYVAEMKVRIQTVEALLDKVASIAVKATDVFDELYNTGMLNQLLENAEDDGFFLELSQLKIAACEMAIDVTNMAMQVYGGSGYKRGSIVERCYRDARAGSLMGPTDDILKVIIGKRLLGLPFPWKN